ncbi:phospholipase A-2-activating protein [Dendrothele bispora CBS 962.96]|uniref:Phospholipase A-2-activating protein n=1 Tax=Dendrothele bispora (strain CBS 962.96) TaxID=1314807 RepID=A0A4S8KZZ4_DENBC|nr:phospholipase A-2-activating protein [Dendrothele bispora CBS 962.96]
MPYKLSATLKAHSSDVRAVKSPTNDLVLSASRDTTAISWQRQSQTINFSPETVLRASSRYVNAVAYLPPTPESPKGYAVTGSQDSIINVFSLSNPRDDPDFTLLGHSENVCALDVTPGGVIISGSWDRTAKVWKNFDLAYELKGHEQSVWAVLAIDEEQVLTASADKTIKLWMRHKVLHTFTGHQDAVRGLALIPDLGFASCSNDSEIRVWTFGGDVIYSLSGHTSFVYSLSVLPNGDIVSGGEDRSVRVWKDGECSQVLVHPAISVWTVSTMPNGDIVTGSSDGVVRIFSESEERWTSAAELKEYNDQVANQALPSQQVGDVKKSDLPGLEALETLGKKPGEVKMVRNGDKVEAHQWDAGSYSWQKVGDVVDAVGQNRKQLYQGKEYDYVFDVEIEGRPPLKLPYNASENPFAAAQRFLESNDLPMHQIDEVVDFIQKSTSGVNIGSGSEEYVDPYTGASRYRSGPTSAQTGPSSTFVDPFTGHSRYTASSNTAAAPPSSNPPSSQPIALKLIPMKNASLFKQATLAPMRGKIFQFDEQIKNEISTSSLAMYPEESRSFEVVFAYMQYVLDGTSQSPPPSSADIESMIHVMERWPSTYLLPVLDVSRLIVAFCPSVFQSTPDLRSKFFDALFKAAEWDLPWTAPLPKERERNVMIVLRALANIFQDGVDIDATWTAQVLKSIEQIPYDVLVKSQRLAVATVLFKYI